MFSNSEKYINLRKDIKKNKVSQIKFVDKVNSLEKNKYIRIPFTTLRMAIITFFSQNKCPGIYMIRTNKCENIKRRNAYDDLYIISRTGKITWYSTNCVDDRKNELISGTVCAKTVMKKFKDRTGKSFHEAFGSSSEEFKFCVPKSFYYINEGYKNKNLKHISAIDYCSQYPSMLCGELPTCEGCVTVDGQVEPSEEFPFAFYLKSGHCAEYNVFDTRKWRYSTFALNLLGAKDNAWNADWQLDPTKDVTVLMKRSDYSLEPEMQKYYEHRKTDPFSKQVMVSLIGCFHMDYYRTFRLAHLAAVVISRANDRMMKQAEQIETDGNTVLHIAVDGCIYKGTKCYGNDIKVLKGCYQEFTDCDFKMRGTNCYIAMKNGKVEKFKHGAFDSRTDDKDIEMICDSLDDIYTWYKKETELEKLENWDYAKKML